MSDHPELYPHVQAVVDALAADGPDVFSHQGPVTDADIHAAAPYRVVYLIPGGQTDGTALDPDSDAELIVQVTSVGTGPEQALRTSDLTRATLVGRPLPVAGRAVQRVRLVTASGGATRDDDVTPPVFYAVDRFALWSFPAS